VSSLLGEYASLKTVSKIAQGIAEHGEAYAAWVACVGERDEEALERFEDHYLGTYENMQAYVEEILSETGFYRDLDEALQVLPEDLRRYVQVDVEELARNWEIELHVVEAHGGRVMVFDTRM
jgi:antirestriction protein